MPSPNMAAKPGARLDRRIALITGGATGIGAAIVRLFASEGARVSFCSRSEQPGRDLEQELKSEGCDVVFFRCDAAVETEAKALVKLTLDRYGGIDILVNNAAVSKLAAVEEMSLNDWELILSKNLTSMFLMSREFDPDSQAVAASEHHQPGVHLRGRRRCGVRGLCVDQGGRCEFLEDAGARARKRRHPGQRALSWRYRDEALL